jgi:hypothetical protein
MNTIGSPLPCPELNLQPEPTGGIELTESMQQVLATLTGFWRNYRVLLKASPAGILSVGCALIQDILHVTATSANYTYTGPNVVCSDILVMGHPDNTGRVWVKPNATASTANAWPLNKGDVLNLGIYNLNMLNLLIAVDTEKAIIAYTL